MFADWIHRFANRNRSYDSIESLTQGNERSATLRGTVSPNTTPLLSPITRRPCVFYALTLKEWVNGQQHHFLHYCSNRMFHVHDSTGSILLDGGAVVNARIGYRERGHSSDCLQEIRAFSALARFDMVDEYGESRSLSYSETLLLADDHVIATGVTNRRPDPNGAATYREQPMQTILQANSVESR